jgi:hypothetical protein
VSGIVNTLCKKSVSEHHALHDVGKTLIMLTQMFFHLATGQGFLLIKQDPMPDDEENNSCNLLVVSDFIWHFLALWP